MIQWWPPAILPLAPPPPPTQARLQRPGDALQMALHPLRPSERSGLAPPPPPAVGFRWAGGRHPPCDRPGPSVQAGRAFLAMLTRLLRGCYSSSSLTHAVHYRRRWQRLGDRSAPLMIRSSWVPWSVTWAAPVTVATVPTCPRSPTANQGHRPC
jgi:hypothetical protein